MFDFKLLSHDCENPTYSQGLSMMTCAYYPPVFDENGVNTNPDRNVTTNTYACTKCGKSWSVATQYGVEPSIQEL